MTRSEQSSQSTRLQPPSALISSPTITVHLVDPVLCTPNVASGPSSSAIMNGSKKRKAEDLPALHGRLKIATFQLHISVLTAHSEYFKSLISFNGLEVRQNCVYLESMDTQCPENVSRIAFNCFVDFIYTGHYDLSRYSIEATDHETYAVSEYTLWEVLFTAQIYVLATKLLCDGLKKESMRRMRELLLRRDLREHQAETWYWVHIQRTVQSIFQGTACSRIPATGLIIGSPGNWPTGVTPEHSSVQRAAWLGKEPMRKLIAAYLASNWKLSAGAKKKMNEGRVRGQQHLVDMFPELNVLILGYLTSSTKFEEHPLSGFGIEGEKS
ncbi:hypothetical protein BJ508DRAFT_333888 [Ascobolus immersus RN42]|uniref:BTB domain-containing protein n=1 Tax=Ascobolus immersus RN42 TaxID=1160509 RepID=A0A3N4HI69_ASCIM|nr:hypothetical protein BJ508DRAFT_333888 [Ascobolus immersus RN42]